MDRGPTRRRQSSRRRATAVLGVRARGDDARSETARRRTQCDGAHASCRRRVMTEAAAVSLNARAAALIKTLVAAKADLKISVTQGERGETLIDAGSSMQGSIAAGLAIAEICMGGLGKVQLTSSAMTPRWPWTLLVHSSNPVIACVA